MFSRLILVTTLHPSAVFLVERENSEIVLFNSKTECGLLYHFRIAFFDGIT